MYVFFNVGPDAGCRIKTDSVTYSGQKAKYNNWSKNFSFKMPDEDVGEFEKIPVDRITIANTAKRSQSNTKPIEGR